MKKIKDPRMIVILEDIAEVEKIMSQATMFLNKYEREFKSLQSKIIETKKMYKRNNKNSSEDEINKMLYDEFKGEIIDLMSKIDGLNKEYTDKIYKPHIDILILRSTILMSVFLLGILSATSPLILAFYSILYFVLDKISINLYILFKSTLTGRYLHIAENIFQQVMDLFIIPKRKSSIDKLNKQIKDLLEALEKEANVASKETGKQLNRREISEISKRLNMVYNKFKGSNLDWKDKMNLKGYSLNEVHDLKSDEFLKAMRQSILNSIQQESSYIISEKRLDILLNM